jgi:Ca2+:H+ antiporter
MLSVLAIVPLTVLLSIATVSVAAKTGDAIGGLLNATLGNLAELVIALAALRAGQYAMVKASIAGAIVTNVVRPGCVFSAGRTQAPRAGVQPVSPHAGGTALPGHGGVAIPSAISHADTAAVAFSHKLSVGLAVCWAHHLCTEHAVLALDAPRVIVWQRGAWRGRRRAVADGRGARRSSRTVLKRS